jgi:hypothetical protein
MLSTTAIAALQAWGAQNPEVEHLVKSAQALACRAAVQRVKARAAVKGVDAAAVVWSDAICPQRLGGAVIGAYSMDLQARCQQPAICYTPGKQHRDDVHLAASRPLHEVPVPGGMHTLQSFLMNELKVRTIPRSAACKVQALAVTVQGEEDATVKFSTRAYGTSTDTFVFMEDGRFGHRTGDGMVGVEGKALQLSLKRGKGKADPSQVVVVTLFTKGAPMSTGAPVYRSLGAAQVTLSTEAVADMPYAHLEGAHVLAARVEIFEVNLVTHCEATDDEIDDMCLRVLQRQLDLKPADSEHTRAAKRNLDDLKDEAYCHVGHGPYPLGSQCADCGQLCACH